MEMDFALKKKLSLSAIYLDPAKSVDVGIIGFDFCIPAIAECHD